MFEVVDTGSYSCSSLMALISRGIICFFRLTTPGRVAMPSTTSASKAVLISASAPLPAISSSVLELRTSVNI